MQIYSFMAYNAFIFDFDGTIADTLDEGVRIYNQLAEKYHTLPISSEELPALRHMSMGEFFKHLKIPKHQVPKILFQGTRLLKQSIATLPLIAGMKELLPLLSQHTEHLGILTSNSVENVQLFLQTHGLEETFTFISSTSKLSGKSRHLKNIQKSYKIPADQMLYIGDEIRDIRAAQKAKIAMAAVTWGFNSQESLDAERPDFLLQHPSELLKLSNSPTHE